MCSMNNEFDEQQSDSNVKYGNLNAKFDEKFNDLKDEIKRQNFKFDKRIDEMHVRFDKTKEKIVALVNEKFDRPKNKVDENNSGVCLLYTSRCV